MLEGSVWSVFRDQGPEEGLNWAMAAVKSTPLEERMTDAVMQLLTDSDPIVRSRAVTLANSFASRFGSVELLKVLQSHEDLYAGVRSTVDSDGDPDLAWGILEAMSHHPLASNQVRDRLRNAALDPKDGFRLLAALTRDDTDWVLDQSVKLTAGNPLNPEIILANLNGRDRRKRFVGAFRGQDASVLRSVSEAIEASIDEPNEKRELTNLLR
jgi:hypothetical protein